MRLTKTTGIIAAAIVPFASACGSIVSPMSTLPSEDSGDKDHKRGEGGDGADASVDGHQVSGRDGGRIDSASAPVDGAAGGAYVDIGYYYGDGSYFVDGGPYPDIVTQADTSSQSGIDGGSADASEGCAALAACCPTVQSTSQSLCNTVAGAGDTANCAAELAELQGEGNCTGVSILASQLQVPPYRIVSDGTLLFWTTNGTPGLLAMPVGGGSVRILLDERIPNAENGFLAVDDLNLYVLEASDLIRIPKGGGAATLVNEPGASVGYATSLGSSVYWVEYPSNQSALVKSTPLQGGNVASIATISLNKFLGLENIAVTSSTVFVALASGGLLDFPVSGVRASGPTPVDAGPGSLFVGYLTSDADAVYCAVNTGSNLRIASDGSITTLGPGVSSSYIVFDDSYAYWADKTDVGTIMKAPKAGGGTATVLARDTNPIAIAVDATSIYWSDSEGYIKSIAK